MNLNSKPHSVLDNFSGSVFKMHACCACLKRNRCKSLCEENGRTNWIQITN